MAGLGRLDCHSARSCCTSASTEYGPAVKSCCRTSEKSPSVRPSSSSTNGRSSVGSGHGQVIEGCRQLCGDEPCQSRFANSGGTIQQNIDTLPGVAAGRPEQRRQIGHVACEGRTII